MTLRWKLLTIVGATALALILLIVVSQVLSGRAARQMSDIEGHLVPKLALGPRLETQFERIRRALQDAVAAQDGDTLAATRAMESNILDTLAGAEATLAPGEAAAVRAAVERYYQAAYDVSKRLIAGET